MKTVPDQLVVNGILGLALVALAALLGVWFGRTGGTDHCHRPPGTASGAVATNDRRNGRYRREKSTIPRATADNGQAMVIT